jgi:NAD(P)-dependent dehydrogenase (short-subunit alcohol dehydrogenase family)
MKVIITGSSGLARSLSDKITRASLFDVNIVNEARIEDLLLWESWEWNEYDAFINCAHVDFEQCNLLMKCFLAMGQDPNKTIINISSRAAQPNISKGYLYAAQKAALNHLSTNLVYNSDKRCRITTVNLGLLEHQDLPSVGYHEVSRWIYDHPKASSETDVPEITIQNRANYQGVQSDKETLRDIKRMTK